MKLPTCERCNKAIKPDQPAFHRQGVPAFHRKCFSSAAAYPAGRWSKLLDEAGLQELAYPPPAATPKRGTKPDLDAIERRWSPGAKRRRAKK